MKKTLSLSGLAGNSFKREKARRDLSEVEEELVGKPFSSH